MMYGGSVASLIVSAVVLIGGIALIVFRRPLSKAFDRVWSASSRPGSGPLIPTDALFFAWAGVVLIVGVLTNVLWAAFG